MKKVLLAALLVALFGGWFYASPLWTLKQMRDAAQSHDVEKMSAYVNYPALRKDLNKDLGRLIRKEQEQPDSGLKGTRNSFAMAIVGSMVIDALVSPTAVQALFRTPAIDVSKVSSDQNASPIAAVAPGKNPVVERVSLNEFQVRKSEGAAGALVFRRSGFGWKLAGVELASGGGI